MTAYARAKICHAECDHLSIGACRECIEIHLKAAERQGYLRGVKHSARTVDAYACSGKYVVGYGFLGNLRDLETHIRKLAEGIQ